MTGLVGRNLSMRRSALAGVVFAGLGAVGVVATFVVGRIDAAWVGLPMLSLALAVVPFALAYVLLSTALTLYLQGRKRSFPAGLTQILLTVAFVALGAIVFLPKIADPTAAIREVSLSGDAVALSVVAGLIGIGAGFAGHRRVAARPFLIALLVPLIASWPDFLGSYVYLTEGFNAVFFRPEIGSNMRLEPEAVEAVQRSAGILLQYLVSATAAIVGTSIAYVIKRIRTRS